MLRDGALSIEAALDEGTCFGVRYDRDRWARGVLARRHERIGLGVFFGPPLAAAPVLEDFTVLDADEVVYVCRVHDGGLRTGQWRSLGSAPGFERAAWPVPPLSELVEVGGFGLVYDYGDDLGVEPAEQRVELEDARRHAPVGLHLAGAVERELWRLLRD